MTPSGAPFKELSWLDREGAFSSKVTGGLGVAMEMGACFGTSTATGVGESSVSGFAKAGVFEISESSTTSPIPVDRRVLFAWCFLQGHLSREGEDSPAHPQKLGILVGSDGGGGGVTLTAFCAAQFSTLLFYCTLHTHAHRRGRAIELQREERGRGDYSSCCSRKFVVRAHAFAHVTLATNVLAGSLPHLKDARVHTAFRGRACASRAMLLVRRVNQ